MLDVNVPEPRDILVSALFTCNICIPLVLAFFLALMSALIEVDPIILAVAIDESFFDVLFFWFNGQEQRIVHDTVTH